MANLNAEDLQAIRNIIKEETFSKLEELSTKVDAIKEETFSKLEELSIKVDAISTKLDKVLKFVAIENADFDDHFKNNGHSLRVARPQEEA